MADDIPFDRQLRQTRRHSCGQVSPLVRRIVAGNAGPFTFTGTCTYIVGRGEVAVIDPGPEDPRPCRERCSHATGGRARQPHRRHPHPPRPLARRRALKAATRGAHRRLRARTRPPARCAAGESNRAGRQRGPRSTRRTASLAEGDCVGGPGWTLTAVATPGHTANHLAFALPEEKRAVLRRPRDGVVDHHRRAAGRRDGGLHGLARQAAGAGRRGVYWPGHGGPVTQPVALRAGAAPAPPPARGLDPGPRRGRGRADRRDRAEAVRRVWPPPCTARPPCRCSPIWRTWRAAAWSRRRARRASARATAGLSPSSSAAAA